MKNIIKEAVRKSLISFINENNSSFNATYAKLVEACEDILETEREKLRNKEYFYNKIQSLVRSYNELIMSSGYKFEMIQPNYTLDEFSIVYVIANSESWDDDMIYEREAEFLDDIDSNEFGVKIEFYRSSNGNVEIVLSCDLDNE
jgi:hypothetical protein